MRFVLDLDFISWYTIIISMTAMLISIHHKDAGHAICKVV